MSKRLYVVDKNITYKKFLFNLALLHRQSYSFIISDIFCRSWLSSKCWLTMQKQVQRMVTVQNYNACASNIYKYIQVWLNYLYFVWTVYSEILVSLFLEHQQISNSVLVLRQTVLNVLVYIICITGSLYNLLTIFFCSEENILNRETAIKYLKRCFSWEILSTLNVFLRSQIIYPLVQDTTIANKLNQH